MEDSSVLIADATASIFPVPPIQEPAKGAKIWISEDGRKKITNTSIKAINRLILARKKLKRILGPRCFKFVILFGSSIKKSIAGKRLLLSVLYEVLIASFFSKKPKELNIIMKRYKRTIGGRYWRTFRDFLDVNSAKAAKDDKNRRYKIGLDIKELPLYKALV